MLLTGTEQKLDPQDIIVSKTDLKGRIIYANDIFLDIAGYNLREILDKPHNVIRHPLMPRCVFQLLWERLQFGNEIFAYVVNSTKAEDYYWVLAHVTPSMDSKGNVTSYHSNRRAPSGAAIAAITPIYEALVAEEKSHKNAKEGQKAGYRLLMKTLEEKGVSYDEFVLSL